MSQYIPVDGTFTSFNRWVWDIAFSADSHFLVSGSSDGNARLWNVDSGAIVQEYAGHNKAITCLAFYDGKEPA